MSCPQSHTCKQALWLRILGQDECLGSACLTYILLLYCLRHFLPLSLSHCPLSHRRTLSLSFSLLLYISLFFLSFTLKRSLSNYFYLSQTSDLFVLLFFAFACVSLAVPLPLFPSLSLSQPPCRSHHTVEICSPIKPCVERFTGCSLLSLLIFSPVLCSALLYPFLPFFVFFLTSSLLLLLLLLFLSVSSLTENR